MVTNSESQTEPTLEDYLKNDLKINVERGGIVHRLDKDTSGLLVVAKTAESLLNLQSQFKNRTVSKEYLALVHGRVEKAGKVAGAILRNPGNREKFIVASQDEVWEAKEATTEYEPIQFMVMSSEFMERIFTGFNKIQMRKLRTMNYEQFTLLKCHPLTGRTHQIRVHLKYLGFPIVGDEKYGGRKIVRLDHRWCKRQFLHAAHLEFNHPDTGMRMKFDSKLPEDLEGALKLLIYGI